MNKQVMCSGLAFLALAWSVAAGEVSWKTDLEAAKKQAKAENKVVLMNFTGSDWCGFCIKLKKEVFDTTEFAEYAGKNLVLVELDFPRKKQQEATLKQANAKLQAQYKVGGFPIIALNSNGEKVWHQEGYLAGGPKNFIGKLDAARKK